MPTLKIRPRSARAADRDEARGDSREAARGFADVLATTLAEQGAKGLGGHPFRASTSPKPHNTQSFLGLAAAGLRSAVSLLREPGQAHALIRSLAAR